jgi:hypothetical protein
LAAGRRWGELRQRQLSGKRTLGFSKSESIDLNQTFRYLNPIQAVED